MALVLGLSRVGFAACMLFRRNSYDNLVLCPVVVVLAAAGDLWMGIYSRLRRHLDNQS
ncbi:uncharacterized protein BDR25DRAFT_301422 [Lindgomyces ingoldianus]|uniref:Uncharacterized protein n=1 Tax=Lindgomyces ingoldianus TaxID=673940 RepID=A0ACB6R6H1_9PLEO|nr:uncharacterized protein BDR25DRAFT_301422 [Lindgomyces ingoldianus]KAF2474781.1 hypothetical protein BDR25DRAFT_301422 [Lindgomyces ingoldianus]